ncbi:MAG: DUF433 domain-containing protein [Phycisphaerae bacterium]|nr:DUF433 domain-containing protein [Phycisphaerae bacterium]
MNSAVATVFAIDPNILGGTPVFVGTRVRVEPLYDYLKPGRLRRLCAAPLSTHWT